MTLHLSLLSGLGPRLLAVLIFASITMPLGCDAGKDERTPKVIWKETCASCHGNQGQGIRIKLGRDLDMRTSAWQAKYQDAQLSTFIDNGKSSPGSKRMPAFGSRLDKNQVDGLVAILRALKMDNK